MLNSNNRLWPFGVGITLAAVPAIWILFAGVFYATGTYLHWPAPGSEGPLIYFTLAASAIPPVLLLLDFVAARGGAIGNKWLKVDFSKAIAEIDVQSRDSFRLSDNILAEQDRLNDSSGQRMVEAMKRATTSEILYLDLKDGNAWWVTRLLVLCAGVQGISSVKAIVFVGRKENRDRVFLGWGMPGALLTAILNSNPEFLSRFQKAEIIARQLAIFGGWSTPLLPQVQHLGGATPINLHPDVAINQRHYDENDSVMLASITIEQLRATSAAGAVPVMRNMEDTPDRLTMVRLQDLLVQCLYSDAVDRTWPNTKQLTTFLESRAPYVALLRDGIYEGMLRSDLGARAVIRELFRQSQEKTGRQ
jgi:hypothetical protein